MRSTKKWATTVVVAVIIAVIIAVAVAVIVAVIKASTKAVTVLANLSFGSCKHSYNVINVHI